jgi:hypothetical protein
MMIKRVLVLVFLVMGAALPAAAGAPSQARSLLPRNVVISLDDARRFFPDIAREASTGNNATAVGSPRATRSVIYATKDGSKRVTISVDRYASAADALSAYRQAVQRSQSVRGFKPLPMPNVGTRAFAGTVTQNGETHIGLGELTGTAIVGATLAGYDATPANVARLVALARAQDRAVR